MPAEYALKASKSHMVPAEYALKASKRVVTTGLLNMNTDIGDYWVFSGDAVKEYCMCM